MTNYSAQRATLAVASAAALATATAAAYYVYRMRQRDTRKQSEQTPSDLHLPDPLETAVPRPPPQSSYPASSKQLTHADRLSQPIETSTHSSTQVPRSPERAQVPSYTDTEETTTTANSFAWAVFWDIENVPIPRTTSATHFVQALRKTLAAHRKQTHPDAILRIHAIANVRRTSVQLRNHLQANGVNLTHVESKGRKDAADKALITEICLTTREHHTPFGICLISGDGDFSYPVSRLTALGYTTVIVAPTRHSFSTLLEAVPDAVIPLRTVLGDHQNPSIESQLQFRGAPLIRRPNQETMRHPQPTSPHIAPLSTPMRPDKRVTKKKRRERILPTGTIVERDEDDYRPWSSDDDCSTVRVGHLRMTRRPHERYALTPYTDHDSQTPANQVHRPYVSTVGNPQLSPQRLAVLPNQQMQIQDRVQQNGDRQGPNDGSQSDRQPSNGCATHPTTGSVSGTIPTSKNDVDRIRASHSNRDNDRRVIANGPRVRFAGDTIIPDKDKRIRRRDDAPPENRPGYSCSESSKGRRKCESKKQASSARSGDCPDVPIGSAVLWLYYGTRALPFVILLIVLGFSLLLTLLRVVTIVLEGLLKV